MSVWLQELIRFFFPADCISCQTRLPPDERWLCKRCQSRLILAETDLRGEVAQAEALDGVYSGYFYEEILQSAIHHFKYSRALSLARIFANRLAEVMRSEKGLVGASLLVPLPLHPIKKRTRGFNQAALVAAELSHLTGIELDEDCVARVKNNVSQTTMHSASERILNVTNIFKVVHPDRLVGKTVVIVDDLITTGATMNECARAVREAGAAHVIALSVGRPLLESNQNADSSTNSSELEYL